MQSIPEQLTVSVEGADVGTQFTAGSITLPVRRHAGVRPRDARRQRGRRARPPRTSRARAAARPPEARPRAKLPKARPRARARRAESEAARRRIRVARHGRARYWWSAWAIPGPQYATTRHNLGFLVADILADRIGSGFKVHKKSGAEVVTGRLAGRSVVLAKPRCYMNESGRQVGAAGQVLLGGACRHRRHPRRARHRLRSDPAEVRRRRRRPQRPAVGRHPRWAPTTFSGSASGSAVRPAAWIGAAFVLGELHRRRAHRGADRSASRPPTRPNC